MIASRILDYLGGDTRRQDVGVLLYAQERFANRLVNQTMTENRERAATLSASRISHPCGVRAWHKYHGTTETDPMQPRTLVNFIVGDMVEIAVLSLARLAGVKVQDSQAELSIPMPPPDEDSIAVHPDGRFIAEDNDYPEDLIGKEMNLEVKKVSGRGFDRTEESGLDDTWGYLTQASLQVYAWRAVGVPVAATEFVMIAADTGHIQSVIAPYDAALVENAVARAMAAKLDSPPLRDPAFDPVPETVYDRRLKGRVPTGRAILGLACSYCGYKRSCHPAAAMEVSGSGKPVWVVR